jgi:hypothetical protein
MTKLQITDRNGRATHPERSISVGIARRAQAVPSMNVVVRAAEERSPTDGGRHTWVSRSPRFAMV